MDDIGDFLKEGKGYSAKYKGSYFDDDIIPRVRLEEELDIDQLTEGKGGSFTIDDSEVPVECEELGDYEAQEVYKYLNPDMGSDSDGESEYDGPDSKELSTFERRAKKMVDVTADQDKGVLKRVKKEGSGDVIKPDSFVTVNYNMYLEDQDEPADSTFLRNRPLRFPLGKGDVVEGLDIAVRTMRVGEAASFLVHPQYFLGDAGCPPRIPANSKAMFHVELMSAEDSGGADEYYSMSNAERREAKFSLIKQVAMREKVEGNSHYKGGRWAMALRFYNRAIRIVEDARLQDDEDERQQQKFLFQVYKNAALCSNKLNKPKLALSNINNALHIDRTHAQAFYIKGKALRMVGDYEAAKDALLKAKQIKPNDHDIANELKRLDSYAKKYKAAQTSMYQKMFFGKAGAGDANKKGANKKPLITDHTTKHQVDDDYMDVITEKLKDFKMNLSVDTLPLPRELSNLQICSMASVCEELGLEVEMKGSDTNVHFVVKKPKVMELP